MSDLSNNAVLVGNTPVTTVSTTGVLPPSKCWPKNGVFLRQHGCYHPVVRPKTTPTPLLREGGVVGGGIANVLYESAIGRTRRLRQRSAARCGIRQLETAAQRWTAGR